MRFESDFQLGVYDLYRMGALRFRLAENGPFLHDEKDMTVPPFTSLRTLEEASLRLEDNDNLEDPAVGRKAIFADLSYLSNQAF